MLGYEAQEMLGKSVFDFIAPAFAEEAQRSLRLRREGVNEQLEFPFRAKDGHEVWTLMATSSLGAGNDHRHHRAEGHEFERTHLTALVQSSSDSIIGMSTSGMIESWNDASSRLYGYGAMEAMDQDAPSCLARDPLEREQLVARAAEGDRHSQVESQDLSKNGRVIDVSVADSAIRDAERLVIGVSRIADQELHRQRTGRRNYPDGGEEARGTATGGAHACLIASTPRGVSSPALTTAPSVPDSPLATHEAVSQTSGGLTGAFLRSGLKKRQVVARPRRALPSLGAVRPLSDGHSERIQGLRRRLCETASRPSERRAIDT
jgi:PAS domain S-box-containing protein